MGLIRKGHRFLILLWEPLEDSGLKHAAGFPNFSVCPAGPLEGDGFQYSQNAGKRLIVRLSKT